MKNMSFWLCPFPAVDDPVLIRMRNIEIIIDKPADIFLRAIRIMADVDNKRTDDELLVYSIRTKTLIKEDSSLHDQGIRDGDVLCFALAPKSIEEIMLAMMEQNYVIPPSISVVRNEIDRIRISEYSQIKEAVEKEEAGRMHREALEKIAGRPNVHLESHNMSGGQMFLSSLFNNYDQKMEAPSDAESAALANELSKLRAELKRYASTRDHDKAIGKVADAEEAAANGDVDSALKYLKDAGKWVFEVATKIGVGVATEVAKKQLNL